MLHAAGVDLVLGMVPGQELPILGLDPVQWNVLDVDLAVEIGPVLARTIGAVPV